jgi:hypothetical protein
VATIIAAAASAYSDTLFNMENPSPCPSQSPEGDSRQAGRQRARVACKRCRRLRKKCLHEKGQRPCFGCVAAGPSIAEECIFPRRGEPDLDRSFRRNKPQQPAQCPGEGPSGLDVNPLPGSPGIAASASLTLVSLQNTTDRWSLLPPYEEVVEACKVFGTSFFQLGFIPKALFLEQLANDRESINVFFLLGVLSVSARFTPSLITRYGDGFKAAEVFLDRAAALVIEEMYTPTLERTQAFFLLAIAEWGKGDKTTSNIHMGIAVRMAGLLRLHREETYALSGTFTAEDVIKSEMARRTFWMLESQDNLHSGYTTPASFSLNDITTLLPCEERDFAFGEVPQERAALAGTLAASRNPNIVHTTSRSLFAILIQAHNLWGQVARRAVSSSEQDSGESFQPWDSRSDYALLSTSLRIWEERLPRRHLWSIWNLRGYKAEGLDLAYLAIVMVLRLSNIILRGSFIENIKNQNRNDGAPENFWANLSTELFENVLTLHEQIDAFFSLRSQDQGFPALITFCVYVCGSLANHLRKRPEICPKLAPGVENTVSKSLEVLSDLQHAWPLARRWREALEEGSLRVVEEQQSRNLLEPAIFSPAILERLGQNGFGSSQNNDTLAMSLHHPDSRASDFRFQTGGGSTLAPRTEDFNWQAMTNGYYSQPSPADDLEAQLTAFLQIQGQLGILYEQ